MSFRSLKDDREHEKENVKSHRKAGKKRSNSAPTIGSDKNVDATDSKGRTALYYAAKYGEIEIVRHLLSNGADPNLHDKMVNYPIHEAVDGGHLDVVELLIRKGCNIDCKNAFGQTPLMRAALFGDLDTVKLLVKAGSNLDAFECTGKTALLIAFRENNNAVCKYLISSGCDVNCVDHLGNSALYFATHNTQPSFALCQKLFRHGYSAKQDTAWLSEDLHRKLAQNGVISRVFSKLGLTKTKLDIFSDSWSDDYSDIDIDTSRQI